MNTNIKEIQQKLGIPVTGVLDEFTQAAWRNYCLRNNLKYEILVGEPETEEEKHDQTLGFLSTDLSSLPQIKTKLLSPNEYMKTTAKKEWLFLHFTAGWDNPYNVVSDWENDSRGQVGTQFVIGGKHAQTLKDQYDGEIVQCMPNYQCYGWHLGIGNTSVHRNSVGIEVCNVGPIKKVGNDYLMWANKKVNPSEIIDLKREYRGFRYFQKLTDDQLHSLNFLITKIANDTGIDVRKGLKDRIAKLGKDKAFDFDQDIKDGKVKGLFVHTNVSGKNRFGGYEKFDFPPMDNLIDLINSL